MGPPERFMKSLTKEVPAYNPAIDIEYNAAMTALQKFEGAEPSPEVIKRVGDARAAIKKAYSVRGMRASPPPPRVPRFYRYWATGLGASMWFFLMYRAKKDGAVLLGWKHPWDH